MKKEKLVMIVPDIHNRQEKVEKDIEHEKPDKIIFLGDEFDSWGDTPAIQKETAKWLKWSLYQKNRIHLWGNHSLAYAYNNRECVSCPGYTKEKDKAINSVLGREDWDKIKWFYILDGVYLLSHAGVDGRHIPPYFNEKRFIDNLNMPFLETWLNYHVKQAYQMIAANHGYWIYNCGFSRGGNSPLGGIVWTDWGALNNIPGIPQIVGHTIIEYPRWKYNMLNLDTNNNHYAVWDGQELKVKESLSFIDHRTRRRD